MKWKGLNNKGQTTFSPMLFMVLAILIVLTFIPVINTQTIVGAISRCESAGYIVLASGEYSALKTEVDDIWAHDHSEQFVAPLAAPITLTSGVGAYTLGNFSDDFIAAGATTGEFDITAIGFGTPDINGTYTVILYAGATDVEIGQVSFNRQGVFTSSIYRDMSTIILPAGTRIRAKMMDSTGGATCVSKIYYHYN